MLSADDGIHFFRVGFRRNSRLDDHQTTLGIIYLTGSGTIVIGQWLSLSRRHLPVIGHVER
jgi:hypothetical protein